MNKTELVEAVAKKTELTKAQTADVVEAVFASIQEELANGGQVGVIGFGTFSVSERAARTGRNPRTGKKIKIAASRIPKFKAGKGLKDAVAK
ncbi:MAG: HU family DNA-binding protein [Magnetococcales bacterium]|nr:HU family DNA-binding protein [Magnetococcales bacterium]